MPESFARKAAEEFTPIISGLVETTQKILITDLFGKDAAEAYPFKLSAMPKEIEESIAAIIERHYNPAIAARYKRIGELVGALQAAAKRLAAVYWSCPHDQDDWMYEDCHSCVDLVDIWECWQAYFLEKQKEAAPCQK
jgi:hypothetical protein